MILLNGSYFNDTLVGEEGNDVLNGLAGEDILSGKAGNDTLDGGPGADTLNGGLGSDIYVVDNVGDIVNETEAGGSVFLSEISRVSTDSNGLEGNSYSFNSVFSASGKYVVFESYASNLVANDTNGYCDVFVKNLATGATVRVSTDVIDSQANGYSYSPNISADGTQVTFTSEASNLVEGDANGLRDVFVKNLVTGLITRVSTDVSGTEGHNWSGYSATSADGSLVVFGSDANNLVTEDTNGMRDIFLRG